MNDLPRGAQHRTRRPADEPAGPARPAGQGTVLVWDLPIRLFHWVLVLGTTTALATGFFALPRSIDLHTIAGWSVGAALLFRLVWGLLGSGPSRLTALVHRPSRVLDRLAGRDRHRYLGHNPLAGLVLAGVLVVALGLVVTGAGVFGGEEQRGPLRAWLSWDAAQRARAIHLALAWALLGGIALHLAGLTHEAFTRREAIARSMLHGRRLDGADARRPPVARARPLSAALWSVGLIASFAFAGQRLSGLPPAGVRDLAAAPGYDAFVEECGACHLLYHPSLLPAASWEAMTASLDDHFGEDASLSAETTAAIAGFLSSEAQEGWDTEAAHRLRPEPGGPPPESITEIAWWRSAHDGADDALLRAGVDRSASDCESCHSDAVAGTFGGESIHDPHRDPSP